MEHLLRRFSIQIFECNRLLQSRIENLRLWRPFLCCVGPLGPGRTNVEDDSATRDRMLAITDLRVVIAIFSSSRFISQFSIVKLIYIFGPQRMTSPVGNIEKGIWNFIKRGHGRIFTQNVREGCVVGRLWRKGKKLIEFETANSTCHSKIDEAMAV